MTRDRLDQIAQNVQTKREQNSGQERQTMYLEAIFELMMALAYEGESIGTKNKSR